MLILSKTTLCQGCIQTFGGQCTIWDTCLKCCLTVQILLGATLFMYILCCRLNMSLMRERNRRWLVSKLIDGFDLCDLSPLPHAAHPHCDHPRRVDPSNEIQMLQSSCVKRHPGCYLVGGKTINEALRNVLKILWSVLKLPHGNICVGAPPHLRHAVVSGCTLFLPLPLYLYGIFSMKKNNNERLILKSKGN